MLVISPSPIHNSVTNNIQNVYVCMDVKNNTYRHIPQVPGNPGDYEFCTVVFHICGSSVLNVLCVNFLAPRTLR